MWEIVVQGSVNPDEYHVFKPTLISGHRPIIDKRLGSKEIKMVYDDGSKNIRNVPVSSAERAKFALNDEDILQLGRWACLIEDHYSNVHGKYTPMDMEWAKDGITNQLFIVQARPETVQSQKQQNTLRSYKFVKDKGTRGQGDKVNISTPSSPSTHPLTTGRAVGEAISNGKARVIVDISKIEQFQPGEILVTDRTDPDWEPIMKKASASVTNSGGRTCHSAIIARELGLPAIVGCENATEVLKTSQEITVSCAEGEEG